jgi:hypothetical protein
MGPRRCKGYAPKSRDSLKICAGDAFVSGAGVFEYGQSSCYLQNEFGGVTSSHTRVPAMTAITAVW